MYARVAKWEGAEADALRQSTERIKADASSGPPDGVPAKGFLMLIDEASGRSLAVSLFETQEDLRKGDAVLNEMNPSAAGVGHRVSVESYEVAIDIRL
jgi:hypothetical protein